MRGDDVGIHNSSNSLICLIINNSFITHSHQKWSNNVDENKKKCAQSPKDVQYVYLCSFGVSNFNAP